MSLLTDGVVLAVSGIVLGSISILLFDMLTESILVERRSSGLRKDVGELLAVDRLRHPGPGLLNFTHCR